MRLCDPATVASAESVMVPAVVLMLLIVAPTGMPVPVTPSPTVSPVVLARSVTTADPTVSVPVKAVELEPNALLSWMAKLPKESVELLESGVIDWPLAYACGSNPPMTCP